MEAAHRRTPAGAPSGAAARRNGCWWKPDRAKNGGGAPGASGGIARRDRCDGSGGTLPLDAGTRVANNFYDRIGTVVQAARLRRTRPRNGTAAAASTSPAGAGTGATCGVRTAWLS